MVNCHLQSGGIIDAALPGSAIAVSGDNDSFGGVWPQKSTTSGKFTVLAFKDVAWKKIEQNPKCHLQVTLPDLAVRTAFVTLCAYDRKASSETTYEFHRIAHP